MKKFTNCIWLEKGAEDAFKYYKKIFKDSKLLSTEYYSESNKYGELGTVMSVEILINKQSFMFLNGGDYMKLNSAVSFIIYCKDQKEIDYYYNALGKDGKYQMCGWLTDKFGVTWQVYPEYLLKVNKSKDEKKKDKVMGTILQMKKYNLKEIKKIFEGR